MFRWFLSDKGALFSVSTITKVFYNCCKISFDFILTNFNGSDNVSSRFSGSLFPWLIPMDDVNLLVFSSKVIVSSSRLDSLLCMFISQCIRLPSINTGDLLNVSKLVSKLLGIAM